jgi:hypothetical protein
MSDEVAALDSALGNDDVSSEATDPALEVRLSWPLERFLANGSRACMTVSTMVLNRVAARAPL